MTPLLRTLALGLGVLAAGTASAEATHLAMKHGAEMKHGAGDMKPGAAALADGTIRKIDKAAGKVTIKHGPLANLNMPPMTMAFKVQDAAMLDKVKVGDQVGFVAESINGVLTVTELKPAK